MSQVNENLFQISFKDENNHTQKQSRIVNLDQNSCSCKRITFSGYPCWHILAVLNSKSVNLINIIPNLVHPHWKCYNSIPTSSYISNQSPNTFINNFKNSETLKKKASSDLDLASSSQRTPLKQLKKEPVQDFSTLEKIQVVDLSRQFAEPAPIKFIRNDSNSCSYDVFLAEATVLQNAYDYLTESKKNTKVELLLQCITKINNHEFSTAQKAFREYCIQNKVSIEDMDGKTSILTIYNNYYTSLDLDFFALKLNISYECTSPFSCPYKLPNQELYTFDSIAQIQIESEHNNLSESLRVLLTQGEVLCKYCYQEKIDTSVCVRKTQISSLPFHLKLGLESLFSSTNRIRRGLSKFNIDSHLQIQNQKYCLKSIVYFLNFNHYNIEILDPALYIHKTKVTFKGWYVFDSINANFKKVDIPTISKPEYKISKQCLPLIVTYERDQN